MKEIYLKSEERAVVAGTFTEFNQEMVGIKEGDLVDVVFTDPANGENLIKSCKLASVGTDKISLDVLPHGYTEVSPELEIFLMGIPANYPVNS